MKWKESSSRPLLSIVLIIKWRKVCVWEDEEEEEEEERVGLDGLLCICLQNTTNTFTIKINK